MSKARVMQFLERRQDRYFVLPTGSIAERNAVALKVICERYREGYYYPTVEEVESEAKARQEYLLESIPNAEFIKLLESEVLALPETIRGLATEAREKYDVRSKKIDEDLSFERKLAENIRKLVEAPIAEALQMKTDRGNMLALSVLSIRAEHQYEDYLIIDAEDYEMG